jgi:type IV secretory pathway component VirB8
MVSVPIWVVIAVVIVLAYLVTLSIHLHHRVKRLEQVVYRLEGVSENEIKQKIKKKMLQYDDGGS